MAEVHRFPINHLVVNRWDEIADSNRRRNGPVPDNRNHHPEFSRGRRPVDPGRPLSDSMDDLTEDDLYARLDTGAWLGLAMLAAAFGAGLALGVWLW